MLVAWLVCLNSYWWLLSSVPHSHVENGTENTLHNSPRDQDHTPVTDPCTCNPHEQRFIEFQDVFCFSNPKKLYIQMCTRHVE